MELLPSGLPEWVADDENLARFLTSSSQFNSIMAKPSAFLPNPKNRETSVFRHGSEPKSGLIEIAGAHITGDRAPRGAAICKALQVRMARLEVMAQEPPRRHGNIGGWPWSEDDPELARAQRKDLAILIAKDAELILF